MNPIARLLIMAGAALVIFGLIWQFGARALHLGRLPGDIVIERENARIYIPIMTSILISILLSILGYIIRWLNNK